VGSRKYFFVVVGNHDVQRLRRLKSRIGLDFEFSRTIKEQQDGTLPTWGFLPDAVQEIWDTIHKGDKIYFSANGENFTIQCQVKGKKIDKSLAEQLWGSDLRSKSLDHIIVFDKIVKSLIGFNEMLRYGGKSPKVIMPGIYQIKEAYVNKDLIGETKQMRTVHQGIISHIIPKMFPIDLDGAPGKARQEVVRYIRDTAKSKLLKLTYNDKCQICGYRIGLIGGRFYSEVHHIRPLNLGGPDNFNNMIVLCPTHHAEFDYGVLMIAIDGRTIVDKEGVRIGKLDIHENHKLARTNIEFLLSRSWRNN
jgi:5-methylcytosine-specific restriction endonuclease McrA